MEEALIAKLLASSGLTSLAPNIQWAVRVGDVCVALHLIDDEPDHHMEGPSGLSHARVQVDCWALTFLAAKNIGKAVVAALPEIGEVVAGVRFDTCIVIDRERTQEGASPNYRFRTRLDLSVWHATA